MKTWTYRKWIERAVTGICGIVFAAVCAAGAGRMNYETAAKAERADYETAAKVRGVDYGTAAGEESADYGTAVKGESADYETAAGAETVEDEIPRVALTFDDGPSEYTEELSQGLKERGVQATFFLLGENMEGKEEVVKRLAEDGHLLGNHSYHHVQLNKLSETKACQEIVRTNNLIYEYTGIYPMYVRPPYGEWDTELDCGVDMIPVFWNVDSLDWKLKNTDQIVKKVMEQVEDGDIILMHDGYSTSVEAAFRIVDTLQEEGYQFVTADKMLVD